MRGPSESRIAEYLFHSAQPIRKITLGDVFFQLTGMGVGDRVVGGLADGNDKVSTEKVRLVDAMTQSTQLPQTLPAYRKVLRRFLQEFAHPYEKLENDVDR